MRRGLLLTTKHLTSQSNLCHRFIEKYGTHIVVGVKIGGKDVIHIKQLKNSNAEPAEILNLLKKLADERFSNDLSGSGLHGKQKVHLLFAYFFLFYFQFYPFCKE